VSKFQELVSRPMVGKLGLGTLLSIAGLIGPLIFLFTEYFTFFTAEYNNKDWLFGFSGHRSK
jgi:hypothetical protein